MVSRPGEYLRSKASAKTVWEGSLGGNNPVIEEGGMRCERMMQRLLHRTARYVWLGRELMIILARSAIQLSRGCGNIVCCMHRRHA